jgi:hypothetical protein
MGSCRTAIGDPAQSNIGPLLFPSFPALSSFATRCHHPIIESGFVGQVGVRAVLFCLPDK